MTEELSLARVRELLDYDQSTGVFKWKVDRRGHVRAGQVAGKRSQGYVSIRIDGKDYRAHRLAFFLMTGEWPSDQVDHISGDRADNRWVNLRDVSHTVNQQNRRRASLGKLAPLGAYWIANNSGVGQCGHWYARIKVARRLVTVGRFATAEEAGAAYVTAKRRLHAGCTI